MEMIVLVPLLPVPRLGQLMVKRLSEHGPANIEAHLDAQAVQLRRRALGFFHRGALIFEAKTLVERNHRVPHSRISHQFEIGRISHARVPLRLVVEVVPPPH